jgi:hypothetical protein
LTVLALIALANLSLSWILLDPSTDRAVKASSQRPVAVDRKWLTGNMVVRFGLVLGGQRLGSAALQKAKEQVGLCGAEVDRVGGGPKVILEGDYCSI